MISTSRRCSARCGHAGRAANSGNRAFVLARRADRGYVISMKLVWLLVATSACVHARETVSPKVSVTDIGVGWSGGGGARIHPRVAGGVRFIQPLAPAEPGIVRDGGGGGVIARDVDGGAESSGLHGTLVGIKIGADVLMNPQANSTTVFVLEGSIATPLQLDLEHQPAIDEVSIAGDVFAGVGWKTPLMTIAGGPVAGVLEAPLGSTPYLGIAVRATMF